MGTVSLMHWHEMMLYFEQQARRAAQESYIPQNELGKFVGDYLHAATLHYDTLSREAMHRETLEFKHQLEAERRTRYGGGE